jgi:hypothetical protein
MSILRIIGGWESEEEVLVVMAIVVVLRIMAVIAVIVDMEHIKRTAIRLSAVKDTE